MDAMSPIATATSCGRCDRTLVRPEAQRLGYGMRCARVLGILIPRAPRERAGAREMRERALVFNFARKENMARAILPRWSTLRNKRMAQKLSEAEAINVSDFDRTEDGDYIVPEHFRTSLLGGASDWCDAKAERWIGSIGIELKTGRIVASTSNRYYQNDAFRCVFLR